MTDVQIRAYIDSLAEPLSLDEVIDASVVARVVPLRPAHQGRPWMLAAVLVAVLGLAGLAAVALRDSSSPSSVAVQTPPSTVTSVPSIASAPSEIGSPPFGVEEPLVEVAITGVQSVAKPGSVQAFSVQGHPDLLVWTTLMLNPQTGHVEEWRCVSEAGGSGCGSVSIPAQFGQTSSIDNQVASDDLFTWINLPPDVAIVTYDDGVKQLWQRTVSGSAIFRVDPDHPHPTISAYDAYDAALPYSFWGQNPPLAQPPDTAGEATTVQPSPLAVSGQDVGELDSLVESSMNDCLTSNGATWPMQNVPSFGAGADPVAVWNECVVSVQSIVAAREAALTQGQ